MCQAPLCTLGGNSGDPSKLQPSRNLCSQQGQELERIKILFIYFLEVCFKEKFMTRTCLCDDGNHDAGQRGLWAASRRWGRGVSPEQLSNSSTDPGGKADV